jgi:hypothetical protein
MHRPSAHVRLARRRRARIRSGAAQEVRKSNVIADPAYDKCGRRRSKRQDATQFTTHRFPHRAMSDLLHRIKVFVFSMQGREPHYLLLRAVTPESLWGPIQGSIGFGEKLESAIRREVMDDIGIGRPLDLIDLQRPARWLVGDEEVIEWSFGFRTHNELPELALSERWAEARWAFFSKAYPQLELEPDRAAIMRLHTLLHAA